MLTKYLLLPFCAKYVECFFIYLRQFVLQPAKWKVLFNEKIEFPTEAKHSKTWNCKLKLNCDHYDRRSFIITWETWGFNQAHCQQTNNYSNCVWRKRLALIFGVFCHRNMVYMHSRWKHRTGVREKWACQFRYSFSIDLFSMLVSS